MPDHFGRKKSMLADMIIIGAGASIRALAKGPAMLFVGQLLVETGVGIDFPVSSSYVSEILPQRSRARMMVATTACQSLGMLLAAAITLVLLRTGTTQTWRLFLATEGAVALLFFVLRLSPRESPHWLMSRGKFEKAALAFIRIIPEELQAVLQVTGTLVWVANERCSANQPKMTRPPYHDQRGACFYVYSVVALMSVQSRHNRGRGARLQHHGRLPISGNFAWCC